MLLSTHFLRRDLHGRNLQGGLPTGWSKFKELRAL